MPAAPSVTSHPPTALAVAALAWRALDRPITSGRRHDPASRPGATTAPPVDADQTLVDDVMVRIGAALALVVGRPRPATPTSAVSLRRTARGHLAALGAGQDPSARDAPACPRGRSPAEATLQRPGRRRGQAESGTLAKLLARCRRRSPSTWRCWMTYIAPCRPPWPPSTPRSTSTAPWARRPHSRPAHAVRRISRLQRPTGGGATSWSRCSTRAPSRWPRSRRTSCPPTWALDLVMGRALRSSGPRRDLRLPGGEQPSGAAPGRSTPAHGSGPRARLPGNSRDIPRRRRVRGPLAWDRGQGRGSGGDPSDSRKSMQDQQAARYGDRSPHTCNAENCSYPLGSAVGAEHLRHPAALLRRELVVAGVVAVVHVVVDRVEAG